MAARVDGRASAVCLMDTYSHLIHSVRFGAFAMSEVSPFIAAR